MKICIIGSKGFIGTHLTVYCRSLFFNVLECDVVTDYSNQNYFLIDAINSDYTDLFINYRFDVCINCSGAASVQDSINNPLRDFNLNAYNVFKILDAIRKYQPECKFLNLSSAAVYGDPKTLPIHELCEPLPISPYGRHKLISENICKEFHEHFNLKTSSLRIFSAYGPGLKKQLFWDVFAKASKSDEVVLFGTGYETRDFIFIDDLVDAIIKCLENASFEGEVINIANGKELSIRMVVSIFLENFMEKKEVTFTGRNKIGDPEKWCADIRLLQSFHYSPTVSIKEGLYKYFTWITRESKGLN
jgi:UDP-glucose 4-epimerase